MLASFTKMPIAEDIVSKTPKNRRSRLPHCRLTPHLQGTPTNIHIDIILPETRVIGLHLRRWLCGSIFIQIFVVGSETRMCFETERIMSPEGHPRSVADFGTNRKRICDFLLVIKSNLCHTLPRFRDIAGLLLRRATPNLFPYFGGVPIGLDCWNADVVAGRSEDPKLITGVITF